ncbi:auxin-responsive protein SAUR71 [Ziziphus jujuba]|uniref:Auxin-responsive protein SAUR71 n=1 Tax=Ziziphus jujuba TaxID=326968 RepID=A0A6P3YUJ0_ZIZJJ|nr:auxin-responsive protein SAUR71 [Ziziphus jujuba]
MDVVKAKWKKNLFCKAWERCLSLGNGGSSSSSSSLMNLLRRCRTTPSERKQKRKVAPRGCFSVYVGELKQRFVVKAELANHPLFKMLLEDAEMEYGFNSEGPILLDCDVDLFYKVLAEMESGDEDFAASPNCSSVLLSPCRSNYSRISNGYGNYTAFNHI